MVFWILMTGLLSRARSIYRVRIGIEDGLMHTNDRPVVQSSVNNTSLALNRGCFAGFQWPACWAELGHWIEWIRENITSVYSFPFMSHMKGRLLPQVRKYHLFVARLQSLAVPYLRGLEYYRWPFFKKKRIMLTRFVPAQRGIRCSKGGKPSCLNRFVYK